MTKVPLEAKGITKGILVAQDLITRGIRPWPCTPRLSWASRKFIRGPCFQGRHPCSGTCPRAMLALAEDPPSLHIPLGSKDRLGAAEGRATHSPKPLCAQFCIIATNSRTLLGLTEEITPHGSLHFPRKRHLCNHTRNFEPM